MEEKKRKIAWAILNRFGDLWSHDLMYTKEGAEEKIRKVCDENGWSENDFRVVQCTITYKYYPL